MDFLVARFHVWKCNTQVKSFRRNTQAKGRVAIDEGPPALGFTEKNAKSDSLHLNFHDISKFFIAI